MKILEHLVVGIDGSPASGDAIALALRLAKSHGSEVHFAHAVDYMAASDFGAAVIEALTNEGHRILSEAEKIARNYGVRAHAALLDGRPEYAIARYVEEIDAGGIVVGARGNMASERFFVGSTAEGVLRLAMVPVFVARDGSPTNRSTFDRIMVAVDNSDPSDAAVEFGTMLAAADGSHLTFCHVVDEDTLYEEAANYSGKTYPVLHEWLDEANAISAAAGERAEGNGVQSVETSIVTGDPTNEIVALAGSQHADLIVIGAHGRRGLRHLTIGSVAYGVVRKSRIPVVVVRRALAKEAPVIHPHIDRHGYVTLREDRV